MEKVLKHKRITGLYTNESLQKLFDELVGWEIVHYSEKINNLNEIFVVIVVSKKQNDII